MQTSYLFLFSIQWINSSTPIYYFRAMVGYGFCLGRRTQIGPVKVQQLKIRSYHPLIFNSISIDKRQVDERFAEFTSLFICPKQAINPTKHRIDQPLVSLSVAAFEQQLHALPLLSMATCRSAVQSLYAAYHSA